jgi:CHAT domain-containing protein
LDGAALSAVLLATLLSASGRANPTRECDALVRAHPRDLASYRCYWDLAHNGQRAAAERGLEAILRREPGNPRALFYLGLCQGERGLNTRDIFVRAVNGLQAEGDREAEGYARLSLFAFQCFVARDCEQNEFQLARADGLAEAYGLKDLHSVTTIWRASEALMNDDFGASERLLRAAEGEVGPAGPAWVRANLLRQFGLLYLRAERYGEALVAYRQLAELAKAVPSVHAQAVGAMAAAAVHLAQRGELPRSEAEGLLRQALAEEEATGLELADRFSGSLATKVLLAFLEGPSDTSIQTLLQVRDINRRRDSNYPFPDLWVLANFIFARNRHDAPKAVRYADEAVALCNKPSHEWERAHGLLVRSSLAFRSGDRPHAEGDARAALDGFERLRGRQPEEGVRVRYGASTAFAHQLVSGWLLDPAHGSSPPDFQQAFEVMERLRGRVLLESLLATGERRETPPALSAVGRELHTRIAALQRRLMDPSLGAERKATLAALDGAELAESEWRDDVARARPRLRNVEFSPPRLSEVQGALRPNEAMLLFQTWRREPMPEAPLDDGSSWVLVVTSGAVGRYRIPDAEVLDPETQQWLSLLERRDGSEREGAVRLHHTLLDEALSNLSPAVTQLILVPDGPLHALPFDALRAEAKGPALAERYVLSLAPSASLWLRWRMGEPPQRSGLALALADPAVPGTGVSAQRAAEWRSAGASLGALPHARAEARTAVASAAPGSQLLVGVDASEHALKSTDLRGFDLLHFATHAVVDVDAPERSAVVLAPGAEEEDGLLQLREIAELDLTGKVIILAACSSASGQGLAGEGVLGLARAFFEAGAHAVVGSLWPLRDEESALLLEPFYRRLAEGASVGEALADARRERISAGAPASAWAGLILLGDSGARPVPAAFGQARRTRRRVLLFTAALLVGVLGLAAGVGIRRRAARLK